MTSRTPIRLSRRVTATSSEPCVFCTHTSSYGPVQKRYMAARRAPSTRIQQRRTKPMILTPELNALRERKAELEQQLANACDITQEQKHAIFSGNASIAERLSDAMALFVVDFRHSPRQTQDDFDTALRQTGVTVKEVYESTFVLRNLGSPDDARFGRHLVRCCDRAGYAEATIQSVASLLRQDLVTPGLLRGREALLAQGRLKDLCKAGDLRALVLDGKLAERKGDPDLAISLYEQATDRFMSISENDNPNSADKAVKHLDELSSPWMELGILHLRRGDRRKALEAYMLGIMQDDPMAHHMLGRLDYQFSGGEYSNDWLYNVTKAAASGHYRAAYTLGEYYANTKAPSAPAEVFASSKADNNTAPTEPPTTTTAPSPLTAAVKRITHFLSTALLKPVIETDAKANIAHYASAVQDPVARLKLAYEWLSTSSGQTYLPAYLHLARIHFRKYVLGQDNLSDPDLAFQEVKKEEGKEKVRGTDAVEKKKDNPLYNREKGYEFLRSVFVAYETITEARRKANVESEFRERVGKLGEYPDVLEDYESNLDNLLDEAKSIADAVKMDITDDKLRLLYKYQPLH